MAIRKITTEQIAATRVNFSSAQAGTDKWRQSADVAVLIANDSGFQDLETQFIDTPVNEVGQVAEILLKKSEYVRTNFGNFPFFDAGVEQAANFAARAAIIESRSNQ